MKTVMITGANRGLGRALAEALSPARLLLHQRKTKNIYPNCITVFGDLRDENTLEELTRVAYREDLDILINNAATYLSKPFLEMTEAEIREIMEVNLIASILLTRAVWPIFSKKRKGMVINISSIAINHPGDGESIYAASKAGLSVFSRALQFDATRDGVSVVNVLVGAMRTEFAGRQDDDKLMDPAEVAKVIASICKDYKSLSITEINLVRRLH